MEDRPDQQEDGRLLLQSTEDQLLDGGARVVCFCRACQIAGAPAHKVYLTACEANDLRG